MGLTIFKMAFEVLAVVFFLIFFVNMEDELEQIVRTLKRRKGTLRQGGGEREPMTEMWKEFIGKTCQITAESIDDFDEDDPVTIQEVDGEWVKLSYMEGGGHRKDTRTRITQLIRVDDIESIKVVENLGEYTVKGGAKPLSTEGTSDR